MAGTEFLLQIEQRLKGDNPVTELQKTEQALKAAMGSYKELEAAATRAGQAQERAGAQVAAIKAKLASASDSPMGDSAPQAQKLAAALAKAEAAESALAAKAASARSALAAQEGVVSKLAGDFEKLSSAEKKAANAEKELTEAEKDAKKHTDDAEKARLKGIETTSKTGDGLSKLGGPLGSIGGKVKNMGESWKDLSSNLGTTGATMAVAAVAIVAVVAVLVMGAAAMAKFALTSANAARTAQLTKEAFLAQVDAGKELGDAMTDVEKSTGIAGDRQKDIIRSLQGANVAAGDIPAALKAIAEQEAALGDSSGTQQLVDDLKSGKKSVTELADEMDSKFGGIAKKKMLDLDVQASTLGKNFAGLFSGINIDGLLEGISKIVSLFDSSTESGAALKSLLTAIFQPLGDSATGVFPAVERMILNVILAALKVGIAVKKAAKEFNFDTGGLISTQTIVAGLEYAFISVGIAVGILVAAVALCAAQFALLSAIGAAIGDALSHPVETITSLWNGLVGVVSSVADSIVSVGTNMMSSLADAITSAGAAVISAITGVVSGGIDAAKSLLGIHSPSKVFAEIGDNTAEGFSGAIEDNTEDSQSAMAAMVSPPEVKSDASGKASAGGGKSITIGQIVIQAMSDNARGIAEQIASELERALLQSGGSTEPAPAGA